MARPVVSRARTAIGRSAASGARLSRWAPPRLAAAAGWICRALRANRDAASLDRPHGCLEDRREVRAFLGDLRDYLLLARSVHRRNRPLLLLRLLEELRVLQHRAHRRAERGGR